MTQKLHSPAAERNRLPILEALQSALPASGRVLEIASGSGQHAAFMASSLPHLTWCPSDIDPDARASIEAHRREQGLPNLEPALALDASRPGWPGTHYDAIVCINMIHIAPWKACLGLFTGGAHHLPRGAPIVLYGPLLIPGVPTAESNLAFDRSLRDRNPSWGLRDLAVVEEAARSFGFTRAALIPCPANNHVVVFRKQ